MLCYLEPPIKINKTIKKAIKIIKKIKLVIRGF